MDIRRRSTAHALQLATNKVNRYDDSIRPALYAISIASASTLALARSPNDEVQIRTIATAWEMPEPPPVMLSLSFMVVFPNRTQRSNVRPESARRTSAAR